MPDIGYVGCSNSWMSVEGYPGERFWEPLTNYSGGTVEQWCLASDPRWSLFNSAIASHGAPALVWFQICAKGATQARIYKDSVAVLGLIRQRTAAPIHVSGLNCYATGYGPFTGWQRSIAVAAQLAAEGKATAGPVLPCLGAGQLEADKIHPNPAGRVVQGQALFDCYG